MSSLPPASSRPSFSGHLNSGGKPSSSGGYRDVSHPSASDRLLSSRGGQRVSDFSDDEDEEDEVPRSFLFEDKSAPTSASRPAVPSPSEDGLFIDPTAQASSAVSTGSSSTSSGSSSTSEATTSPRARPALEFQPITTPLLPLPVTSPSPVPPRASKPRPSHPPSRLSASSTRLSPASASSSSSAKHRRPHRHRHRSSQGESSSGSHPPIKQGLDDYERALWEWVNVQDLDGFLQDVYAFYKGKGVFCIILARVLNLATIGFVIGFSTFLLGCVDFSLLRTREGETTSLDDVLVPRCVARFSGSTLFALLAFASFYVWQVVSFLLSIPNLLAMHRFYLHLLGVPDADIQTISWPTIVHLIGQIRESNPLTSLSSRPAIASLHQPLKLDAHDIANRILRQENYLIALFNKEVLDLSLPIPKLPILGEIGQSQVLTRALEWNLRFCLMGYLCDGAGRGGVRKVFLKERNKATLVEGLQRRLIFMAGVNALFAPFIVLYLLMYSFFRYFEEYHKNPSSIGGRTYTPYAKWKFREFNELPHLFQRRLDSSYPISKKYIEQFPNERTALIMRFVSFVAGSFAAVLILASVLDPDLVLHFEITPHRTVLFYITLFGTILAVARGMVPEDNLVFDPELLLRGVVHYTHYLPDEWQDKLHSQQTHAAFGQLFAMKVAVFAQEILSVVLTPFILWLSLPRCAPAIIDFFREYTVHVDGIGYVCSFAVFDFKRHGSVKSNSEPSERVGERLASKNGKMEQSILNFKATHVDWMPADPTSSAFLSRLTDLNAAAGASTSRLSPLPPRFPFHPNPFSPGPAGEDITPTSSMHAHSLVDHARRAPVRAGPSKTPKRTVSRSPGRHQDQGRRRPTVVPEEPGLEEERENGWDDVEGQDERDAHERRRVEDGEEDELEDEGVRGGDGMTLLQQIYRTRAGGRGG